MSRPTKEQQQIHQQNKEQELIERAIKWNAWKNDPILFIEECCMLPTAGGDKLVKLYTPQKKIINEFFKSHYLVLLKSRQLGFSTICQYLTAFCTIFYDNCKIGIISRSGSESSSFNRKVLDIIDKIPYKWVKPNFTLKNARSYKLENGSGLTSAAVSWATPENCMRGESFQILIFDECSFVKFANEAWTAIAPTLSVAQKYAKENNSVFGTIFLSTPNGKTGTGEFFYKRYITAAQGDIQQDSNDNRLYKSFKIHWSEVDELKMDENWYPNVCQQLNNDPRKIAQELELQFVSSDTSLFSDEIQLKLNKIVDDSLTNYQRIDTPHGPMYLFKHYDFRNFYFIGVDGAGSAGSAGNDYSVIQVVEYPSMDQVLEYRSKVEPINFSKIVKQVCEMFPYNLIIVERTGGYTQTVLNDLIYDRDKNYNVYNEVKIELNKNNMLEVKKHIPGLNTDKATRPLIIESMFNQVICNTDKIKSPRLALELLSLTNKNDKIQAEIGFNDDLVMAYGFIFYVINYQQDSYMSEIQNARDRINNNDNHGITNVDFDYVQTFVTDLNKLGYTNSNDNVSILHAEANKAKDKYLENEKIKKYRKELDEKLIKQSRKEETEEDEDMSDEIFEIFSDYYKDNSIINNWKIIEHGR